MGGRGGFGTVAPVTGMDIGRTVLVTPLAPARGGNGLAMRGAMLLEALANGGPVDLVVIPVSGSATTLGWARAFARQIVAVDLPVGEAAWAHVTAQLADPRLRDRLAQTVPVPYRATLAPPTLAATIADLLGHDVPPTSVVALRSYLAPVGIELGRCLGARVVVDVDDDDEALLRALGADEEADASGRLAAAWLPEANEVWAASPREAAAIADRHGLQSIRVVPNAIRVAPPPAPLPGSGRLLFVGNLTYGPNLDAARTLALDVLPRVRDQRPDVGLTLVGPGEAADLAELSVLEGVHVTGLVGDLAPWYGKADVVVVPLRHGAGTRIKVLEACGFGRPVVASTAAMSGLDDLTQDGIVVADGPDATATAVLDLLGDPSMATARARAARRAVHDRYSPGAVGPTVRRSALGEPDGSSLRFRVLWHDIVVDCADRDVQKAMEAIAPIAEHAFAATASMRYGVEGRSGAYRVVEEGDLVARVSTAAAAGDVVHQRLHRRAFERVALDGWARLHGALVDLGGKRVLIVGPSGAGKSTLALRLLLDGAALQGDESVLLRAGESVAVARPLHLKAGADLVVPELADLGPHLPAIDDVLVADPGRLGYPWRLTVAPVDHIVMLTADGTAGCTPISHTEALPALVSQLFPVTETKAELLRRLTTALAGVRCHRLGRGDPAAMVRAMICDLR